MYVIDDIIQAIFNSVYEGCCSLLTLKQKVIVYVTVILPLTITAIMLGLYVNPKYPEFSVEEFYVPAFNKTASNATSSTISFDIKVHNQNPAIGLYYDGPVNVTFSFIPRETTNKIIWKYSVPRFYQGNAQSRRLRDVIKPLEAPDLPVFNQTVMAEHSITLPSGATTKGVEPVLRFRVDFIARVRFRLIGKHHAKDLALSADVPIGATTGIKFAKKGIKASSGSRIGWGGTETVVMVVLTAINLIIFM